MSEHTRDADRLLELLADERLGQLSPEDRAELETRLADTPAAEIDRDRVDTVVGQLLVELATADAAADDAPGMPKDFRDRLARRGRALIADDPENRSFALPEARPIPAEGRERRSSNAARWAWLAAAASLAIAASIALYAVREVDRRETMLADATRSAEARIAENQQLLADARQQLSAVNERLSLADERRLELTERLAEATRELDAAELRMARYERPEDPAVLAENRRQLLDLSGTIRIAWQPFDVPGLPDTEQPGVSGDVVWNDDLQQGYLRFEGLAVNDPAREQYQVWVIDDRGLEQKVSGGVFNASADGEVVVPIEPGIDVGRVQLFAVTVEEPGGIWVPDLTRRVVVAPRDAGQG